jgi:hypothetical protein
MRSGQGRKQSIILLPVAALLLAGCTHRRPEPRPVVPILPSTFMSQIKFPVQQAKVKEIPPPEIEDERSYDPSLVPFVNRPSESDRCIPNIPLSARCWIPLVPLKAGILEQTGTATDYTKDELVPMIPRICGLPKLIRLKRPINSPLV